MSSNNNNTTYNLRARSDSPSNSSNNNNNSKPKYYTHPLQIAMQDHTTGAQVFNTNTSSATYETRSNAKQNQSGYWLRQ